MLVRLLLVVLFLGCHSVSFAQERGDTIKGRKVLLSTGHDRTASESERPAPRVAVSGEREIYIPASSMVWLDPLWPVTASRTHVAYAAPALRAPVTIQPDVRLASSGISDRPLLSGPDPVAGPPGRIRYRDDVVPTFETASLDGEIEIFEPSPEQWVDDAALPRAYQVSDPVEALTEPAFGDSAPVIDTRIVQAPGFTQYYSDGVPVYLRYDAGDGCLLEYDYGLDGHRSESIGEADAALIAPEWGRVWVRHRGYARVDLDLTQVDLEGCTLPREITLVRSGRVWSVLD
ncbi:MAG: hypothetical protein JJ896_15965 [Rhodothermales bacterium]|nr:hypothetical protein [Rhodothermales bacterium]MBO6781151.1 hypothetical protein [Rhodothermales bacterium]